MSAKDYVKKDATNFGDALGELVNAVRGDGVSAARFKEITGTMIAMGQAVNEMKDVPEAAGSHILGAASIKNGDYALERALAEEDAAEAGA